MNFDKQQAAHDLEELTGSRQVLMDEPLSRHTTFRIGGPADLFVMPASAAELAAVLDYVRDHEIACFLLGSGSDLLVSDKGFSGVIISCTENLTSMYVDGDTLVAQAGCSLKDVCDLAWCMGLGGLEFACGIPGSVGGACFMNAGAYDGQISDVLESCLVVDGQGEIRRIKAEDLALGYRTSLIKTAGLAVVEARFRLEQRSRQEIRDKMDDLTQRREAKQPLEMPSAGSTFKRPAGHYAGKLICDAGLQGFTFGGAQVSEKHAGFVVNADNATAEDVRGLIRHIQKEIKEQFDVDMEPEVRFIGDFE